MDYENAKAERDFRMNPPSNAPGQGDDDGWGDIFDSEPTGSSSAETTDSSSIMQSTPQSTEIQSQPIQNPMQQGKSTEDMVIEGTVLVGKGLYYYVKALIDSVKGNTSSDWHRLGVRIIKISSVTALFGVFFTIVHQFMNNNNQPLDLVIGSLISMGVGVFLSMYFDLEKEEENITESVSTKESFEETVDFWGDLLEGFSDEDTFSDNDSYEDNYKEEAYEETDWEAFLEDESNFADTDVGIETDSFDVDSALEEVQDIPYGTQTRQYLFETFTRILPLMNPEFSDMKQITEDENEFYNFDGLLRGAAYQVGTKEECIPELLYLSENDFIYRLTCSRPAGIKEQLIADELANAYSRDDNNMLIYDGVYATIETSVGKFSINLFKGSPVDGNNPIIISLGDVYSKISEWVLNPKVKMPFVWGINEFGKTLHCDLKDCQSIIISGEPDGGKSWKGQSILAQLCMFNSPKEVNFYIFDPKDNASDYRYFSEVVPHVKYFCGDEQRIPTEFEKLIVSIETKRSKLFEEAGKEMGKVSLQKIEEYNLARPGDKMPYIYIVVDEMMALMTHLADTDKELHGKFKGLMRKTVSELRYLGIRVILFPHRIVDNVIEKNTYSLVSSRAVVRQLNKDEIKNSMGATPKEFPYSLVNKGDMAIRTKDIANGKTVYCHAEILTNSNEGNKNLYDFIGGVWKRLEPDCDCIKITGSVGGSTNPYKENILKGIKSQTRDNTEGVSSFEYKGLNNGVSVGDLDDEFLQNDEDSLDTDDSFWDTF